LGFRHRLGCSTTNPQVDRECHVRHDIFARAVTCLNRHRAFLGGFVYICTSQSSWLTHSAPFLVCACSRKTRESHGFTSKLSAEVSSSAPGPTASHGSGWGKSGTVTWPTSIRLRPDWRVGECIMMAKLTKHMVVCSLHGVFSGRYSSCFNWPFEEAWTFCLYALTMSRRIEKPGQREI